MFGLISFLEKASKFFPLLRKMHFKVLRQCIRGYFILRKNGLLHFPAELKGKLEETRVLPKGKTLAPYIFGSIDIDHDLIVRQFLLSRYFCPYSRFNFFLMAAIGSNAKDFCFPLPITWRRLMTDMNLSVNTHINSFIWWLEILAYWIRGLFRILTIFSSSFLALALRRSWPSNYASFLGGGEEILPDQRHPIPERNIFNWYATWKGRDARVNLLVHAVKTKTITKVAGIDLKSIKRDLPYLPSYSSLIIFAFWGISSCILSFIKMVTGKWWDALLLDEAAKAKLVKLSPDLRLAREYFFMYDWTYRPIWTYFAELKGSKIFFFFYSTNSEQFKTKTGYIPLLFDWRPINWPNYIVWDRYQADFIARHSRFDADYHIVGPIHLSGKVPFETEFKKKSIAVFDVMPMRRSIYATLGLSKEYFVPKTCKDFVQDIIKIASELDCHVYLKTKRTISKRIDPSYRHLLESVHQFDHVTVLSGDFPAETLIKKTMASVSMPWTSTALIAKFFAKPGCYYDSSGSLFHDDRGAHGVRVCIGKNELREYLTTLVRDTSGCDVNSDTLL